VFGYVGPYTLQPYLVARHGSGFIGMMVSFVPLMTILVSIPMLRVYPTARQIVGVLGGLACIGLVLSDGVDREIPYVDLTVAASVPLAYAVVNTYIKRRFAGMPPLFIALGALALSSILLWPVALALPSEHVRSGSHLGMAIACVAVLGVLGTGLAIFLFYKLLQEHGPLFAGMVTYLVPVGAIVLGWLDDEQVTALQLTALGGIFVMVALVQYGSASVESEACGTASGKA
jgi:drug/metabolite transporter (DMT)-like permease